MFRAEARGLQAMVEVVPDHVPKVIATGTERPFRYLLLDYLPPSEIRDWKYLGETLARLHRSHFEKFGFETDNFIGSLEQSNSFAGDWPSFYRDERITRQARMAKDAGLLPAKTLTQLDTLCGKLEELIGHQPAPSLLHGDLWSGNAYFAENGPYLIDPATYYGDREVDIAMTQLFGGFSSEFYSAYQSAYPLKPGYKDRLPLYQLYYLLVHVNLFGRGYLPGVERILNRYVG